MTMPARARWILPEPPDADQVRDYAHGFGLADVVVNLALQRGFVDQEDLERFLYPRLNDLSDPFQLPGIGPAIARIFEAVDRSESVVLYGDYDVDGVSSIALLDHILRAYGLTPRRFLPTRLEEGYGLSAKGIAHSFADSPPELLIAADCGTNSRDEAKLLSDMGIDLIVVDHHEPSSAGIADCVAVVNPKLGPTFHYLCTAGVVFKIAHALLKTRPLPGFDLKEYLDIVALGTIADIVPLEDENRIFARRGLQQLDRTIHPGLVALKEIAGVKGQSSAQDVGFKLGPRLNAAGRLDTAETSLNLLLSQDTDEAEFLAAELNSQNRERQALELGTRNEAESLIAAMPSEHRAHAIVVGAREWHPGVVGIVASRISKQYHRPTFVIGFDEVGLGKGSGRSVEGISLVEALDHARDLIESGGGHEMAAGVTLREEQLDAFRIRVIESVVSQATRDALIPKLYIDAELSLADLGLDLLESYELLRPFGAANAQPLFMSRQVRIDSAPRVIKEKHLKFRFSQNGTFHDGIYFNAAELDLPRPPWDIAYTIDRNEWRGRVSLSMVIQAVRKAG
ncbi:MAG: single-stranded-DNA-specific exonuclease RecJ [Verrucomicrobiota bacterium]